MGAPLAAVRSEDRRGESAAAGRIRLATFNIHHGVGERGRLDTGHTADAIAGMDVDVIGLQEVDRFWSGRSAFVDQAGELTERLGMHMVFGASLYRTREAQGRRQYGVALLSRYPIRDSRNTLLPRSRGGEQRTLLEAEIVVRGLALRCLTTHLQHRSRTQRMAQATAINVLIEESDAPTVLMGDLNARPDTPEVEVLTEHLVDAWPGRGEGSGHTYRATKPVARLDYVLTSPAIWVERARVVTTDASDHLPVAVDLLLPPRRAGARTPVL